MLSLVMLMTLPGMYSNVRAVNEIPPLTWSPFGPQEQQLLVSYYGDFAAMFAAFESGQIDITDWPVPSADITGFCANPDFFCLDPPQFGIFHLDINSHPTLMGVSLTAPRTIPTANAVLGTPAIACSAGFGSLTITLRNLENSSSLILDTLNTLTAANQPSNSPSATVSDSGGTTPNGVYNIPCILAGTYSLSSSIYGGSVNVPINSNQNTPVTLNLSWNSNSNVHQSSARTLWGHALGHMIDKSSWATGFCQSLNTPSTCTAVDNFAYSSLGSIVTQAQLNQYTCSPLGTNLHPLSTACTTGNVVSLDNLVADSITSGSLWWATAGGGVGVGQGYSGAADLQAACDDLVAVGFSTTGSCAAVAIAGAPGSPACTTAPCTYPHVVPPGNIVYYIRTDPQQKSWGSIIADTLNFLFGTPQNVGGGTVCYGACPTITPKYYTISQVAPIVFQDGAGSSQDGWQLYTGSYSLSATPDYLYSLFTSTFGGSICGTGSSTIAPSNYRFYCDPAYDTWATAAEFSPTHSHELFVRADQYLKQYGAIVPIKVENARFVELNGWNFQQTTPSTQSSIVNTLGHGTGAGAGYWTLLNARQVAGYNPCAVPGAPANCASYVSGGGNPNLIRRGFSQDTDNVSPFLAVTPWEVEVTSYVFDSMLALNPNTGGSNAQLVDWQTTSRTSIFNPNEVSCNALNRCMLGTTTQIWHLRNDIKFQDGNPVTANDVAYSIIAYRDVPSAHFQSKVAAVTSAVGLDCGSGQPCKTLQVKLQGTSLFFDPDIGGVPIIEKSLWAPYCGDPPIPGGVCASPTFDPMYPSANSPGIMVGSGPWSCIAPISGTGVTAGHIGGPCAETATGALTGGAITTGGRILLSENTNFMRCCPNGPTATSSTLYKISYADFNNDGVVNILDLANIASHYGTTNAYWCNPNIACTGSPGVVGAVDLATVAIYYGHGITTPYTPQTLLQVDPQIDPFFCNPDGSAKAPGTLSCV